MTALKQVIFSKFHTIPGLIHAEISMGMTLGAPVFSTKRMFSKEIVWLAQWESEDDLKQFLKEDPFGQRLHQFWHVRLECVRQWGSISGFNHLPTQSENINGITVAVTLAQMKIFHIPRFLKWGRPVEEMVKNHPESRFSYASIRIPNLISTFSIWESQQAMRDMVKGTSAMPQAKKHQRAMEERNRKDFYHEFTTLRCKPISEHGQWKGKTFTT